MKLPADIMPPARGLRIAAWLAILASWAALPGCQAPVAIDAWAADDAVSLGPTSPKTLEPDVFDGASRTIHLFAGGNETVGFQLVIDAPPTGWNGLKVNWTGLSDDDGGKIAAENIRAFRCLPGPSGATPPWYPVLVGSPPMWTAYDRLSPVDADKASFNLAPRERLALWFDLAVPSDAKAGDYHATVRLAAAQGLPWDGTIRLHVYDFALSDERPIRLLGGFDYRTVFSAMVRREGQPYLPVRMDQSNPDVIEGLELIRQMMRQAHRDGLDLFESQVRPLLKRDLDGNIRLDWTDYDAFVAPYMDGSAFDDQVGGAAWPMPLAADWPLPDNYGGSGAPDYLTAVRLAAAACRRHFSDKPWSRGKMFLWPCRGAGDEKTPAELRRILSILRPSLPGTPALRPMAEGRQSSASQAADPCQGVDLIAPPGEEFQPSTAPATARASPLAGDYLTPGLGVAAPSLGWLSQPSEVRALCWLAYYYRCRGIFIGDCLNWQDLSDPPADTAHLFYPSPGTGEILPSIRLKHLRRGLQDVACLDLLRQRRRDKAAEMVLRTLVGRSGPNGRAGVWDQSPALWRLARRLMAEELATAVHPDRRSSMDLLAQQMAWERCWSPLQAVRAEHISCRVAPDRQELTADVSVDLLNELSDKVEVQLAWQRLPEGWVAVAPAEREIFLPSGARGTLTMSARGADAPITNTAKVPLPLGVAVEGQLARPIMAEMALLQVPLVSVAPRIDGALEDWPMRSGNCAGDFVLLPRRNGQEGRIAQKQTLAFALADKDNLYFAVRCQENNLATLKAQPNNAVQYPQGVPSGEDLVEVLLAPVEGADANGFYHIAVKPNGAFLAQKAHASTTSPGKSAPWSGPSAVAVGRAANAWTVEMSIPLSALGKSAGERPWRVNFVRYCPAGPEASSWSPAERRFYDPAAWGTMLFQQASPEGGSD